jgi:hypothetical protein
MQDTDVSDFTLLPIDIDLPNNVTDRGAWRNNVIEVLQSGATVPLPSIITSSGNGIQAFYKLEAPHEMCEEYKGVLHGITSRLVAAGFPTDKKVKNPSRLMRLPCGRNFKAKVDGAYPAASTLVDNDRTYKWESLVGLCDWSYKTLRKLNTAVAKEQQDELWKRYPGIQASADCLLRMWSGPIAGDTDSWGDESRLVFAIVRHLVDRGNSDEQISRVLLLEGSWSSANLLNKPDPQREIDRKLEECRKNESWLSRYNKEFAIVRSYGGKAKVTFVKPQTDPGSGIDQSYREYQDIGQFHQGRQNDVVLIDTGNGQKNKSVSEMWVASEMANRYDSVEFLPGQTTAPNILNSWQGFSCQPKEGDWGLFQNHILRAICGGNREHYEWLVKWMAYTVQQPWEPIHSAVVILGSQGAGKGTFTEEFGRLFGRFFRIVQNSDHVVGSFNQEMQECIVASLNESVYSGNRHEAAILKGLITDPFITINPKGVNKFSAKNCLHLIITTNNEHAVQADADDRRFFVLRVSKEFVGNSSHFSSVRYQMAHGGREAMLHDLLHIDLSGFEPWHVPATEELARQKQFTLDPFASILHEILMNGEMPGGNKYSSSKGSDAPLDIVRVSPAGLLAYFNAKKDTFIHKFNRNKFGSSLERFLGIHSKKSWNGRCYEFPPLPECRKRFVANTGVPDKWDVVTPSEKFIGIRPDNTFWEVVRNDFAPTEIEESDHI